MAKTLSDTEREELHTEIFAGRKIQAIKIYREATGEGLKEAKDAVEAMEAELRTSSPECFSGEASKGGCMPVVLMMVVAAASAAVFARM